MSYFIFNGLDSRNYGVLEGMPIPPRAESGFKTVEIPGRLEPLNQIRKNYKNQTITLFLGIRTPNVIDKINSWLNGAGELILSGDLTKYYKAYAHTAITPERLSRRFGKIPVTFTVEPFRYDVNNPVIPHIFTDITDGSPEKTITVKAEGSYTCEPLYYFRWAGRIEMTVNGGEPLIIDSGTSDGEYTDSYTPSGNGTPVYHYISPEAAIFVSTPLRLAYKTENGGRTVCCEMTSGKFPMLEPGENTVKFRLMPEYTWEHAMSDGSVRLYKRTGQKLSIFDVTPNARWL